MSMENPVNGNGLLYFWQKLKAYFAKKSDLDSLSGRVDDIVATGGEPNQNAFSTVKVGSTSVAADSETDTLELVAGSNVTLTPDASSDKITIAAKDTVYTHPAYTARTGKPTTNQTPAFGATFTISQITSDATGHVTAATDRTVTIPNTEASSTAAGLMSSADKSKLDAFGAASTYALKTDLAGLYKYKGQKATVADLPSSGNTTGDVWDVAADGHNYAWNGTAWDDLGGSWRIEYLTNAEIDTIVAS